MTEYEFRKDNQPDDANLEATLKGLQSKGWEPFSIYNGENKGEIVVASRKPKTVEEPLPEQVKITVVEPKKPDAYEQEVEKIEGAFQPLRLVKKTPEDEEIERNRPRWQEETRRRIIEEQARLRFQERRNSYGEYRSNRDVYGYYSESKYVEEEEKKKRRAQWRTVYDYADYDSGLNAD